VRIIVMGAGHVGMTIVEALHTEHELVVVDLDPGRLRELSYAYDVRTVTGNGASREALEEAGVKEAELVLVSTSSVEANLVAAMLVRRLSGAKTVVRTSGVDYLDSWREGFLDIDHMVSPEIRAARQIAGTLAVPGACSTELFAEGRVQVVEFDVPSGTPPLGGSCLGDAELPRDSIVSCIVRDDAVVPADAREQVRPGDRLIVIGSPAAAREWSRRLDPDERPIEDVVVFGAGRIGGAAARELLDRGFVVRIVEPDADRAQRAATELSRASVFQVTGLDRRFLRRERIDQASAVVTATGDDAKNLYLAILAGTIGVPFTLGVVDDPTSVAVFGRGGVDVTINPRIETAEEMIRFAHDPRTHQLAILDEDRFEVLDILVRADSELVGRRFHDLPRTGSMIGALVRDGAVLFPRGEDVLQAGDRAIVLVEAGRASLVERVL